MAAPHLIVAALVRREGRLLLVEEIGTGDPEPTWMLPGGVVEDGESLLEALRRELGEETGMRLRGMPPLAFVTETRHADASSTSLALTFACEADGALAPDDPDGHVLRAEWCPEAEALHRLARVSWYDTAPLERWLAAAAPGVELAVVDRR